MRDSPQTRPTATFEEVGAEARGGVAHYGGAGSPTTIVCGSFRFDRSGLRPVSQLLPHFILIKSDEARTLALHNTVQALASEMAEQAPGSGVVATRLAEVLFIQILRAHIASEPERNRGWLRAVFDPQLGTALSAIHERVDTPWTVESLAETAGMSRSAFAARIDYTSRFKKDFKREQRGRYRVNLEKDLQTVVFLLWNLLLWIHQLLRCVTEITRSLAYGSTIATAISSQTSS